MDDLDQQDANVTGDSGQDEVVDWSQFTLHEPEQPNTPGQADAPNATGDNPKWAPFLETIPTPFHEPVKKHLREWDQGINQRFQQYTDQIKQYAPYKPLIEQNADPDRLMRAYQLADRLASDPVGFYNDLRTGLISRGQLAAAQEAVAEAEPDDPDDPQKNDPYAQELAALRARVEERDRAIAEYFQTQEQEQQIQQMADENLQQIEQSFTGLEQKIGSRLSNELKAEIVQKAMFLGQQQDRLVTIEEAANEVFRLLNAGRQLKAAPRGIPAGGSIPRTPVADPGEMTKAQRYEAAQAIRQRFEGQE